MKSFWSFPGEEFVLNPLLKQCKGLMISSMFDLGFTLATSEITGSLELAMTPVALLGLLGTLDPPQTLGIRWGQV